MALLRDLYHRIVIWQSSTGFVVDIPHRYATANVSPSESESLERVADGTEKALEKEKSFECFVVEEDIHNHLRIIQENDCSVRMIAMGLGGKLVHWQEPSLLNGVEIRGGALRFAPKQVRLYQSVFDAAIFQGMDLLFGIPWYCATSQVGGPGLFPWDVVGSGSGSGSVANRCLMLPSRTSYEGPCYVTDDASAFVDGLGALTSSDDPELVFEAPIGGATLKLEADSGTVLQCLDWDQETVLLSRGPNVSFVVPFFTMYIRVSLAGGATDRPKLLVENAGKALDPRTGECVVCSARALDPPWVEPSDFPNNPSYSDCPTLDDPDYLACIVVDPNTAPYICVPVVGSGGMWEICLNTDAVLGVDDLWRFTITICDDDGDDIDINAIRFIDTGITTYPAGTFTYTIQTQTETGSGDDVDTQREIDFRVLDTEFPCSTGGNGDTITVEIDVDDNQGNSPTLIFTIVCCGGS